MDNHIGFIEKIVDRLDQRKRLLATITSLGGVPRSVVSECQEGCLCWNAPVPANVRFECDNSFTCNGEFDCTTTRAVTSYSQCGGSKDSYECNNGSGFSCSLGASDADYFSCSAFECAGTAQDANYTCSNIDFLCGGPDYSCAVNFQCTAGHLFSCSQEHSCQDNFQCSAGTQCGQPGAATNSCTPGGPVMDYNMKGGGTAPGDFLCSGWEPDGSETFNCDLKFLCNASSDFACASGGDTFTCTGSSSDFGSFECDKTFECYSTFSCQMVVTCGNTSATKEYKCPSGVNYNRQPHE